MGPSTETHADALAAADSSDKVRHGQFFTMVSPFTHPAFTKWLDGISPSATFLEPFAGANNLVRMVESVRAGLSWECYDIEPQHEDVIQRDTLSNFPQVSGVVAVVTNPPYLAKNVARRQGLDGVVELCGQYENLYMRCVAECLAGAGYVAAIIPESFLTAGVFRERLCDVISLNQQMFVDTEVPVCLALWGPDASPDFVVWKSTLRMGTWSELRQHWPVRSDSRIRFNDPDGEIGLIAIDTPTSASIRFCEGSAIASAEVKHSSRHRTRITVEGLEAALIDMVIAAANERLTALREATGDIGLTSFMGLRRDGEYRRRLDFATARSLLAEALHEMECHHSPT